VVVKDEEYSRCGTCAKGLLVEPWKRSAGWPLYNQQRHEAPIEPPTAPAMAGIKLRQRLKAARRRGDIEEGAVEARIANALVEIREAQGRSLDGLDEDEVVSPLVGP
jgi:hypothetical protein